MMNERIDLSNDDIKKRILEVLQYFKSVCEDNDIQYSLAYGTLLGAVRHGGFIPWDDDIDVCLLRDDYERLIAALENKPDERFRLLHAGNNRSYYYNFAKLVDSETTVTEKGCKKIKGYGLYIDIFPLDKCPFNLARFKKITRKIRKISYLKSASICTGWNPSLSVIKNVIRLLLSVYAKLFGFRHWVKKEESAITKYRSLEDAGYVVFTENPSYAEIMREVDFGESVEFEGDTYLCFTDYKDYLAKRYGDYMKLPPENERYSHHNYTAKLKSQI